MCLESYKNFLQNFKLSTRAESMFMSICFFRRTGTLKNASPSETSRERRESTPCFMLEYIIFLNISSDLLPIVINFKSKNEGAPCSFGKRFPLELSSKNSWWKKICRKAYITGKLGEAILQARKKSSEF